MAYVLVFVMVLASLSLAGARGTSADIGTEMVICSGVTMITVYIGPDGQPVQQSHVCPDGTSIFAAELSVPTLEMPQAILIPVLTVEPLVALSTRDELTPSARGPPRLI